MTPMQLGMMRACMKAWLTIIVQCLNTDVATAICNHHIIRWIRRILYVQEYHSSRVNSIIVHCLDLDA